MFLAVMWNQNLLQISWFQTIKDQKSTMCRSVLDKMNTIFQCSIADWVGQFYHETSKSSTLPIKMVCPLPRQPILNVKMVDIDRRRVLIITSCTRNDVTSGSVEWQRTSKCLFLTQFTRFWGSIFPITDWSRQSQT